METIDRAAEWRRLKETYRQMSDDELTAIAGEGYQLTDLAKQALEAEIGSRNLDVKLAPEPSKPETAENFRNISDNGEYDGDDEEEFEFDPEELDLVPLCRVWDALEARQIKGILDGTCIPSYLGDGNLENVDDYTGRFDRGVDLKVRSVDRNWALQTLANNRPRPSGEDDAQIRLSKDVEFAMKCPKCRSTEIVFQGRVGEQTGNAAFDAKYKWTCDSCGHEWEDDGIEQQV